MRKTIGFLFLGPATHIHHAASIAFELATFADVEVTLFVSSELNARTLHALADRYGSACTMVFLRPGPLHRLARMFKKRLFPRVRHVLKHNAARLRGFDALVVSDRTFLEGNGRRPLHILADHGAGDRALGFYRQMQQFDLILVAGPDKLKRLQARGYITERSGVVIGYPKFDLKPGQATTRLFANDKPIVLYNPHFHADESSWHAWHEAILDYFLAHRGFNLVFAPHMLLYGKQREGVARKYIDADNIHVDLDSPALVDMSYACLADIYLGDVSSQVYEFVALRNRPCIFLDAHHAPWQGNENFRMWRMGAVVDDIGELDRALRTASESFDAHYQHVQQQLVDDTFSITAEPAGRRAARAIIELLARQPA
ncbi:MAG: hypothetical protein ACMG5Z_06875 [Luteimonas sp.]